MSFWITSSVMWPELTARYPRAQQCLPQNRRRKCENSCSKTRELMPLSHYIILLTVTVGG